MPTPRPKDAYDFTMEEYATIHHETRGEVYIDSQLYRFLESKVKIKPGEKFKVSSRYLPNAVALKFDEKNSDKYKDPAFPRKPAVFTDLMYRSGKFGVELCGEGFKPFFGIIRPPKFLYFKKIKPKTRKKRVSTF